MPFATVHGSRLHYVEAGSGDPPLVLVHAFPFPAAMWQGQIDALSDRWRVVAPDLPGFGASEPFADPLAASIESLARPVAGLIEHLGLGPVVLGGLSMGGYVAFSLLRNHRALVRALVLADTRAAADTAEVRDRRTRQQEQVRRGDVDGLIETMLGTLLAEDTREHQPDVVEHVRRLMHETTPSGFLAALEAMKGRPDATDELPGIDIPTLVLVGDQDQPAPPDVAQDMRDRLPDARLAIIPRAGHLANLDAPDVFNDELRRFLETVP